MIYKWKAGTRIKADAQTAGALMDGMRRDGNLTPAALVDASRPEDAPLHGEFEWDDAAAAEAYRRGQAAHIIRSVVVTMEGCAEPTRAFVKPVYDGETQYEAIGEVLAVPTMREGLLECALRELGAFRRKYSALTELAGVFDAIEAARNELEAGEEDA